MQTDRCHAAFCTWADNEVRGCHCRLLLLCFSSRLSHVVERHPSADGVIMADSRTPICPLNLSRLIHLSMRCVLRNPERSARKTTTAIESKFFQSMNDNNSQTMARNAIWLLGSARKPARNVHFPACNIQENSHFSSYGINFSYTEQAITNGLEFDYISMLRPAEHKLLEGINTEQDTLTLSHSNQNATLSSLSQAERYQDKDQDILINLQRTRIEFSMS